MTYEYKDEEFQASIDVLLAAHNKVDTALDTLETFAAKSLANWVDSCRDLYNVNSADWNATITALATEMTKTIVPKLEGILITYNGTEKVNAGMWNNG